MEDINKKVGDLAPYGSRNKSASRKDEYEVSKNIGSYGVPSYPKGSSRRITQEELRTALGVEFVNSENWVNTTDVPSLQLITDSYNIVNYTGSPLSLLLPAHEPKKVLIVQGYVSSGVADVEITIPGVYLGGANSGLGDVVITSTSQVITLIGDSYGWHVMSSGGSVESSLFPTEDESKNAGWINNEELVLYPNILYKLQNSSPGLTLRVSFDLDAKDGDIFGITDGSSINGGNIDSPVSITGAASGTVNMLSDEVLLFVKSSNEIRLLSRSLKGGLSNIAFANGLEVISANTAGLGGELTQNTTIELDSFNLKITDYLSLGGQIVDFKLRKLFDNQGRNSINFTTRKLYDATESESLDYTIRKLTDSYSGKSLDWDTRELVGGDGTTVVANWYNGALRTSIAPTNNDDVVNKLYADSLSLINDDIEVNSGNTGGWTTPLQMLPSKYYRVNTQGANCTLLLPVFNTDDLNKVIGVYKGFDDSYKVIISGVTDELSKKEDCAIYICTSVGWLHISKSINLITQTVTNGVTDKSPSEDAVFDAIENSKGLVKDIVFKTVADSVLDVDKLNWVTLSGNHSMTIPAATIGNLGKILIVNNRSSYELTIDLATATDVVLKGADSVLGVVCVTNGPSYNWEVFSRYNKGDFDSLVQDAINDGVTTIAPSQNAVFDALALKQNSLGYTAENSANKTDTVTGNEASSTKYLSVKGVYDWATGLFATISNLALKSNIASPTFTGTVTTPDINISGATASTIAHFDATKNVESLPTATYPNLTELSYVKGVTSAIQTQINTSNNQVAYETWSTDTNYTTVNTTAKRLIVLQTGTLTATRTLSLASVTGAGQEVIIVASGSVTSAIKITVAATVGGSKINVTLNSFNIVSAYSQTLLTSVNSGSWTTGQATPQFVETSTALTASKIVRAIQMGIGNTGSFTAPFSNPVQGDVIYRKGVIMGYGDESNNAVPVPLMPYTPRIGWSNYRPNGGYIRYWDGNVIQAGNQPITYDNAVDRYVYYWGRTYSLEIRPESSANNGIYQCIFYIDGSTGVPSILKVIKDSATITASISGGAILVTGFHCYAVIKQIGSAFPTENPQLYESWSTNGQTKYLTNLGIGHTSQSSSAILQADSTTKGFLPPRMTTVQKNLVTQIEGLVVYDTDLDSLCQSNGTTWSTLGNISGSGTVDKFPIFTASGTIGDSAFTWEPSVGRYQLFGKVGGVGATTKVDIYNEANQTTVGFWRGATNDARILSTANDITLAHLTGRTYISSNGGNSQIGLAVTTIEYSTILYHQFFCNGVQVGYFNSASLLMLKDVDIQGTSKLYSAGGIVAGGSSLASNAILQADSTTKGFLPPRMTNAQRTAITSPAIGLMVYCTDATEGLYIYKSTGWTFII